MTDRRLKDLLDSTAPDQPDLPAAARTNAVTERARVVTRRNRAVLAVAAVAVVGVAVGVPLALDDDGPDPDDGGVAADPAPTQDVAPPACPGGPVDVGGVPAAGKVPEAAVSARMCPATWEQATEASTLEGLPEAPFTGAALDDLMTVLRALPEGELDPDCALMSMAPDPWALVVSTAGGEPVVIGSTMRGCATVPVEGVDRNVEDVLAAVVAAG